MSTKFNLFPKVDSAYKNRQKVRSPSWEVETYRISICDTDIKVDGTKATIGWMNLWAGLNSSRQSGLSLKFLLIDSNIVLIDEALYHWVIMNNDLPNGDKWVGSTLMQHQVVERMNWDPRFFGLNCYLFEFVLVFKTRFIIQ